MTAAQSAKLIILDGDASASEAGTYRLYWRGSPAPAGETSISAMALVEENADLVRRAYLAWVHELPLAGGDQFSAAHRLKVRPELSYWWMTGIAEKCNFIKSPHIDDAVKLIAFDHWAATRTLASVDLHTDNEPLADCIRHWCSRRGVSFTRRGGSRPRHLAWGRLRSALVRTVGRVRALAWFVRHLVRTWPMRGVGVSEWKRSKGQLCFVSYLVNVDKDLCESGRFRSGFWTDLPEVVSEAEVASNWLHIFIPHKDIPTPRAAGAVLRALNGPSSQGRRHVGLHSFLTWPVIISSLRDWWRIAGASSAAAAVLERVPCRGVPIWPLFAAEWVETTVGAAAIKNVLFLNLFEAATGQLPRQKLLVYLQENQPWEVGLLHAWRGTGHGRSLGVPHSTVRYWDLRYHDDLRAYDMARRCRPWRPDRVAVNGPEGRRILIEGGHPPGLLVDVEALRYRHLLDQRRSDWPAGVSPTLLVLGDYDPRQTAFTMRLLEGAHEVLPRELSILVKPHISHPIDGTRYSKLRVLVTMDPLDQLLSRAQVALTSAVTSAAVEAHMLGIPVITAVDPQTLNLSPLRGHRDVWFVQTAAELSEAIRIALAVGLREDPPGPFFFLDGDLPRWRHLLGELLDEPRLRESIE